MDDILKRERDRFVYRFNAKVVRGGTETTTIHWWLLFTVGQYSHPSSPQQQQRQESHSSPTTVDFRRKSFKSSVANRQIKQEQSMHTTFAVLAV
mmetsp:Transcript_102/g.248  ORF Transcript_102/g.248 Transcript_102/m.248 type:complete len:94 (+) Transcript_102:257-538(+)